MKVLITQGESRNKHNVRLSCLEENYVQYFLAWGIEVILVPNNVDFVDKIINSADGVILSGGGTVGIQKNRDKVEGKLVELCIKEKIPLLGICRGMQFINVYFGGTLTKVDNHVNRNHKLFTKLYKGGGGIVNSYHEQGIEKLSSELKTFAYSDDRVIEGIYHIKHKIMGIQWHPERDNKLSDWIDKQIMDDFLGGFQR